MEPVRFTLLKEMAKSPAHYQNALAEAQDKEQTAAMACGSALHSLVLGGSPVMYFPTIRRGHAWDAFAAANTGAIILNEKDHGRVQGMAAAVRACRPAMMVLEGEHELEVDWRFLGRDCRSHLDVLGQHGNFITDLKSTNCAQPDRFGWMAQRYNYLPQLAFYDEAVRSSGRGDPQAHYLIAVESSAPYPVTVLRLSARALEQGRRACRLWMERLLGCEAANNWPAYCESVVELDVGEDELELHYDHETGEVAA
jgi:hypothetical protein